MTERDDGVRGWWCLMNSSSQLITLTCNYKNHFRSKLLSVELSIFCIYTKSKTVNGNNLINYLKLNGYIGINYNIGINYQISAACDIVIILSVGVPLLCIWLRTCARALLLVRRSWSCCARIKASVCSSIEKPGCLASPT